MFKKGILFFLLCALSVFLTACGVSDNAQQKLAAYTLQQVMKK